MQTYSATQKGPLKVNGYIDPNDETIIQIFWGAPTFSPNTVYRIGNVIKPSTDNGYYYECIQNGVSGSSEPTWLQDDTTVGTAVFKAVPFDLWVFPTESLTDSQWSVPNVLINDIWATGTNTEVILANTTIGTVSTSVRIASILETVQEFDLTNQVTKSNSEKLSRTFRYKINQQ